MDAHQFLSQTAAAKHYKDLLSQSQAHVYNDHDWANHLITEGKQLMDLEQHQAAADKFQQALHLYQTQWRWKPHWDLPVNGKNLPTVKSKSIGT